MAVLELCDNVANLQCIDQPNSDVVRVALNCPRHCPAEISSPNSEGDEAIDNNIKTNVDQAVDDGRRELPTQSSPCQGQESEPDNLFSTPDSSSVLQPAITTTPLDISTPMRWINIPRTSPLLKTPGPTS